MPAFVSQSAAALGLAALLVVQAAQPAAAESAPPRHETRFAVKFGALTVGKVTFGVALDGNDYTFTGNGKTQGLADWFAPGKAVIRSRGVLKGAQHDAAEHFLSVTENSKTSTLQMAFAGGKVTNVSLQPDKRKKKKAKKYVLIEPEDLRDVVDPASTMVVPVPLAQARDPRAVCGRTFRVYDGDTRYDMKLSYKTNKPVKTNGYEGNAYVCKLKYVPVAGHRKKHKSVEQMAKNDDMEIWLAPINGGTQDQSVFTAIRILVPTWLGTFSAEPEYFGPANS